VIADARTALGKLAAGTGEHFAMLPCPVAFRVLRTACSCGYAPLRPGTELARSCPRSCAGAASWSIRTHGPSQRLSGDNRRWQVADPLLFPVAQATIVSCDDYGQSRLMEAIGVTFAFGGHDVTKWTLVARQMGIRTQGRTSGFDVCRHSRHSDICRHPRCQRTWGEAIDGAVFGVAA
jgi:hypothetical protein